MGESVVLHTWKLNNRRVSLGRLNNGDWVVRFKMLTDDRKPRVTQFTLSDEAMIALVDLHDELAEVKKKEFHVTPESILRAVALNYSNGDDNV